MIDCFIINLARSNKLHILSPMSDQLQLSLQNSSPLSVGVDCGAQRVETLIFSLCRSDKSTSVGHSFKNHDGVRLYKYLPTLPWSNVYSHTSLRSLKIWLDKFPSGSCKISLCVRLETMEIQLEQLVLFESDGKAELELSVYLRGAGIYNVYLSFSKSE